MRPPWVLAGAVSQDPASFSYELYDLSKDWTQSDNLADQYPDKVKQLDDLFWIEAKKYQVEPLDASVATRLVQPRPNLAAGRNTFTWSGEITGTPNGDAPSILDASFNYKAEVEIPEGGAEGMIVTQGGRFAGYGFWRDCPAKYGPHTTIYNRYNRWSKRRIWQRIFEKMAAAGPVPEELCIDTSHVKAHRSAAGSKRGSSRKRLGARAAEERAKSMLGR
jgi:hypothetical protein